jgi:hypothetical protein
MTDSGEFLMIAGLVVAFVGAAVWGLGRGRFRRLPGDIRCERQQVRVHFPIVT